MYLIKFKTYGTNTIQTSVDKFDTKEKANAALKHYIACGHTDVHVIEELYKVELRCVNNGTVKESFEAKNRFETRDAARAWAKQFVKFVNEESKKGIWHYRVLMA